MRRGHRQRRRLRRRRFGWRSRSHDAIPSCVSTASLMAPLHGILLPPLSYQEGSVRWRRAKLVVVGGGGEGKSAMVRALSGQPFVLDGESTVGAATSMHELARRQVTRPPSSDCYHHRP